MATGRRHNEGAQGSGSAVRWHPRCLAGACWHGHPSCWWRLIPILSCAYPLCYCSCSSLLQVVAPKRAALAEANRKLEAANKKLAGIRAKVKELQDKVATLETGLMKATEDKNAAIAQVMRGGGEVGASMQQGAAWTTI
jgi:septal ring factor EnvC (AmiA/AmiB activator)